MKKYTDYIITAIIFTALVTIIFILSFDFTKKSELDTERVYRQKEEIANDEIVYLDEEAIALNGNPVSTELRNMALSAYEQTNMVREENGLNGLMWDGNLETVANVRSKEIPKNFSHTRPNGQPWYTVNSKIQGGENLAYGFDTPMDVVDAWMDSPTHRDNILYDEFTSMAISVYKVDDCFYWAQEFGY